MKLSELYEEFEVTDVFDYAHNQGYRKQNGSKKMNDETFKVVILSKPADFDGVMLEFKYIVNPETHAWTFEVSKGDADGVQIADGLDDITLLNHLKKKKKLSDHNFKKYFK